MNFNSKDFTYIYKVKKINKIVDGDTVDLEVDLGFNVRIRQRFRLVGYDAPETFRPNSNEEYEAGIKVGTKLLELIDAHFSNDNLYVQSTKAGIYNRWDGKLGYIVDDGSCMNWINDEIIIFMEQNSLRKEDLNKPKKEEEDV
jgi:micrococcal nuclease